MRCAICDFTPGLTNLFTPDTQNAPNNKVSWRKDYNEFQCDFCFEDIQRSLQEFEEVEGNPTESALFQVRK